MSILGYYLRPIDGKVHVTVKTTDGGYDDKPYQEILQAQGFLGDMDQHLRGESRERIELSR